MIFIGHPDVSVYVLEEVMNAAVTVVTVIQVIAAIILIFIVLLQSGKSEGLSGAIAGSSESFMGRNKSHTWDAKIAKATKWVAAVFIILTFVLCLL